MKTTTKFIAAGGAMIALVGLVGAVQADDHKDGRGWRDHGPRHERSYERGGRHGYGGHHRSGHHGMMGGFGMGGHGMGGAGGEHGPGGMMMLMRVFQLADTDGDRSVSQEDLDAFLSARMQQYDGNGDGALQLDEYKAFFAELTGPMAVRSFQFLDPDGDASLTAEELGEPLSGIVERMDRDGDGKLTMQDRGRFHRGGWGDERRPGWRWQNESSEQGAAEAGEDDEEENDDSPMAQ